MRAVIPAQAQILYAIVQARHVESAPLHRYRHDTRYASFHRAAPWSARHDYAFHAPCIALAEPATPRRASAAFSHMIRCAMPLTVRHY